MKGKGKKMAIDLIPADIKIYDRVGQHMIRSNIERGDTVTFNYDGEKRVLLVLENDGTHLKGIDKVRGGDFRNFLFRKIFSIQYAKPFVKAVPVTTVKFEMLPSKPYIVKATGTREIEFANRNDERIVLRVYSDGSVGLYKNNQIYANFGADRPLDVFVHISNFLSE